MITHLPTESEIHQKAVDMFPSSKTLQSSFIQGVYHTIYYQSPKSSKNG